MKLTIILLFLALSIASGQDRWIPGVTLKTWLLDGSVKKLPVLIEGQTPNVNRKFSSIDFDEDSLPALGGTIYSTVTGLIEVREAGVYVFRLTSDDGSRLRIGADVVCDHDGNHSATPKVGRPVELKAGRHPFLIEHFDHGGRRSLKLDWRRSEAETFEPIAPQFLFTEEDPTRLVSPGPKRIVGRRRPGDGRALQTVHPGYRVETIRPAGFEPPVGAMAYLPDGRLIVGTFSPLQRDHIKLPDIDAKKPDSLYAITGLDGDLEDLRVRVVAEGLFEPSGLCAVGSDLFVSQRKEITRLRDEDGDGFFESKERVAGGWEAWNYHQFTFNVLHRKGHLYAALSTAMAPPDWDGQGTNSAPNGPLRGSLIDVDLSSGLTRVIAGGLRTPNGLGFGPGGALFYADNQGTWMPTNQLAHVVPGRFYGHYNRTNIVPRLLARYPAGGHPSIYCDRVRSPAAVLMPQNEVCNSPTQSLLIEGSGPFAGQMLVGELTGGGIRRVFLEEVNGEWQGALFRFTQGLEGGVNRMEWGPGGTLYVGCIGAGGNWHWRGAQFGLQRLVPTGTVAFEMRSVAARHDGLEVRFTKPIDRAWLADPANFKLKQWTYEPTAAYGGEKKGAVELAATAAIPSEDGRGVRLLIPGLLTGHCVHLVTDPVALNGEEIWSTEAWYTFTQRPLAEAPLPARIAGRAIQKPRVGLGAQPPAQTVPLFSRSGQATLLRSWQQRMHRDGRRSQDELMAREPALAVDAFSGDIKTAWDMGDCRLHLEWFVPAARKNKPLPESGVLLQGRYEIAVAGTLPEEKATPANAGAVSGVAAAAANASTGPGTWQAYDIWFVAPRFDDQGNKIANARLTMYWNGQRVHDDLELGAPTAGFEDRRVHRSDGRESGPLVLRFERSDAKAAVRFRNLWVKEVTDAEWKPGSWESLLPDEGFRGWAPRVGSAPFKRSGGFIEGTTKPGSASTYLTSEAAFGDFELVVEVRPDVELNSGIQIRSEVTEAGGRETMRGYQVEVDGSPRRYSGGIYEQGGRQWLFPLIDAPYARRAWRHGQWNEIQILARGPVIRTWINGVPAADVFDARRSAGQIAFQVHGVGDRTDPLKARFRNPRLRTWTRLPAPPSR